MPNTEDLFAFKSQTIVKDEDIPDELRTDYTTTKDKLQF